MRLAIGLLVLLVAVAAIALPSAAKDAKQATITRVIDGDTVEVDGQKVRLIGIDTPEVFFHEECGGKEASAYAKYHFQGRHVRLRADSSQAKRDRYGRLLAYVDLREGGSMNAAMIRAGWAEVYVYDHVPFQRVRPFKRVQTEAKRGHRGVWALCWRTQ